MAVKNYIRKYKIKDELDLIYQIESDKELDSELEKQDYFSRISTRLFL